MCTTASFYQVNYSQVGKYYLKSHGFKLQKLAPPSCLDILHCDANNNLYLQRSVKTREARLLLVSDANLTLSKFIDFVHHEATSDGEFQSSSCSSNSDDVFLTRA